MLPIAFTQDFFRVHPHSRIGLLEISGINNNVEYDPFSGEKRAIEDSLRNRYARYERSDFNTLPAITAYRNYYKQFKKSYHVQLQIESIVLKEKSLPHVNPLVDINFMAEVQTLLLTAGHDVAKLSRSIIMDISRDGDTIAQLNGGIREMRAGDMVMRDHKSVSCSVIYGQDNQSLIDENTSHVLYVTYCPEGITVDMAMSHMQLIQDYMLRISSEVNIEQCKLLSNSDLKNSND